MPLDQNNMMAFSEANNRAKVQNIFESTIFDRLKAFAASVADFRRLGKGNIRHKLSDLIILLILGRTSGHVSRADIIEFGRHNLKKIQKLGLLKNGVPSEATLCRVENGMDNLDLARRMQEFLETFYRELAQGRSDRDIWCIDGKAMRGTVQQNKRNPDIVSAYSYRHRITLATEACQEKSNEITAMPVLLDKLDFTGKIITSDAMGLQKNIIKKIRGKGHFLIELKANQRGLCYRVEDGLSGLSPCYTYTEGPELGHGRIETRTYHIYDGQQILADSKKWGDRLTIIASEYKSIRKSSGAESSEKRLYVSNLPVDTPDIGAIVRAHWSIESMHWCLDRNFAQDSIKRKSLKGARNLDTIQRIVHSLFSIWKARRKKLSDKAKGVAELKRRVSMSLTKLLRFLDQK